MPIAVSTGHYTIREEAGVDGETTFGDENTRTKQLPCGSAAYYCRVICFYLLFLKKILILPIEYYFFFFFLERNSIQSTSWILFSGWRKRSNAVLIFLDVFAYHFYLLIISILFIFLFIYINFRTEQRVCDAGFYCIEGVRYQCPEGYQCPPGSASSDDPCGGPQYYCPPGSGERLLVDDGYYSTGGDYTSRTSQAKCGSPQYYCQNGIRYEANPGYRTVGGDETTRTGQEKCGSDAFYCIGGIRSLCVLRFFLPLMCFYYDKKLLYTY